MSEHLKNPGAQKERGDFKKSVPFRKLAHDLRNHLSSILMQAQLIAQYAETAGPEKEAIKKSAEAIEHSVKDTAALLADE